ncbi:patatin-like phospholipase family protein [Ochrobactrum chromiisoli]|uniref:Patatin family protein n=1 Tax=Ochrobactrum chromiisoli TaxID=2993941 RepID=A0ABT3QNF6_9HYPH|nr:patatin family protein [Ochrobactrum chromiisoli]MCX2697139.1 patatin family protein [Ochrobactrum chromiisoli]
MRAWGQRRRAANPQALTPEEEIINQPQVRHQPRRIALALGGGAARGWAHIGVLRALDEAGIEIEMIAGTSIGALVGGCYLAGKLDQLEEFARSLTRRRMFNLLDITFRGSGLFGGMKLDNRMREHLDGLRLEELDRPFVAVCTELHTGHEIWLSNGPLVEAMRASFALPGVFEPVRWQERVLVDGALVNPVPVSVCRAYEQRLVLAVNLHYDQFGRAAVIKHAQSQRENLTEAIQGGKENRLGITGVMMEAFNIIQDRISRARMAGDPPDVSLMPTVAQIGLADFHRASEAIDIGYAETVKRLEDIKRLQGISG